MIVNIYSKRKKEAETTEADVYTYDKIPSTLKEQLRQMYTEGYENRALGKNKYEHIHISDEDFRGIVTILRREYGVRSLIKYPKDYHEEFCEFLVQCNTDNFLDCAEIYGLLIIRDIHISKEVKKYLLEELNHRFKQAGVGYEFILKSIIRIDNRTLHSEVLKPTLAMLSSSAHYKGAEQEIRSAFDKFKSQDNKSAVSDALKAFESTMKSILQKRKWSYNTTDTASKLISACLANELIPKYMQTHFTGLKMMLESGVPTVRNKTASHGQGSTIVPLDDHYASYVLYTALANMKLLIECEADIPQVACRLTSRSPDFARWASVFRPERCLSSRKRPKSGGSSLEPAAFWPGRAAFPRGRRTCPAAFVQLGHGSWSCA